MTTSAKRLLRTASIIMYVLSIGHTLLAALISWSGVSDWAETGFWAAVPLDLTEAAANQSTASLANEVLFWTTVGGFPAPLLLVGYLIWHLSGRGIAVPAGVGWGVAAWCVVGGILLVPSPFFVGAIAGVLIILASRKTTVPAVK